MTKLIVPILVALSILSSPSPAATLLGGFGMLYPDPNANRNPGAQSRTEGLRAQVLFGKFTGTHEQSLVTSLAYAKTGISLLAYGSRYGMNLGDPNASQTVVGAGAGISLAGGKIALGLRMDQAADPYRTISRFGPYQRVWGVTAAYYGEAISLGVGLTNADVTLAFGGSLTGRIRGEWVSTFASRDWETAVLGGWEGEGFFVSGGVGFLSSADAPQALFRGGVRWGALELSLFFTQVIKAAENPYHGAALRLWL